MGLFPFFGSRKKLPVPEEEFYLNKATAPKTNESNNEWVAEDYEEGQLSVDVYQTKDSLIIKSTIAGVRPEDIDIAINNDMLTIRGKREVEETVSEEDYLYQECYWGGFSRSIILPCEVQADKVEANLKNGVLTITLPKAKKAKGIQVQVTEE
jgi:HSP20 family protein